MNWVTIYNGISKRVRIVILCSFILLTWFYLLLPAHLFTSATCYILDDNKGNLLSASIANDGQWRFPYDENVPEKFIACITTFEDKRFYKHPGVDIMAFGRAMARDIKNKEIVQGGSTLTMQVIRLSRHKEKRGIWQKLVESILAIRLECSYSKKEIMSLYASNAPFGSNVVGLDAASWRYYGRSPEKLSWGEMAALAVLPNSPSLVHPGKNVQLLLKKRNALLEKLSLAGHIDKTTCELARNEILPSEPVALPQFAPHLLQKFKSDNRNSRSAVTRISTTLDINLQRKVTGILSQHHNLLKGNEINNACAIVLDVESGNVEAYAGNVDDKAPGMQSDVDVIRSPRSPGSTLKPLLYAAMLSDGMLLPNAIVADIPTQFGGYSPQNFDLGYDGAVPASRALSRSLNVPAVRLLQQFKYQRFYEVLKECGFSTLSKPADNYGLSLILGGGEVNMWDIAGVYASMARTLNHQNANNGNALIKDFHPPVYTPLQTVRANEGKNIQVDDGIFNSMDPTSIWFTFQAMQEVMRPGEEGLWEQFNSSQKIAWKTGTSFGFRDGWAIGITPKNVVAVWVGNCDGEGRAGLIGVQTAAPILFDIFRELPKSTWFHEPSNDYTFLPVCRQSGCRANIDCPDLDTMMVPKNGYRSPLCSFHKMIHLDPTGTFRVNDNCESPSNMIHRSWFILTPAMEWYYKQKNHDYKVLPPLKDLCTIEPSGKAMEIIYPSTDAKIYVPIEISGQRGKTIFRAAHRRPGSKIFWSLDDQFIETTTNYHQLAISPIAGKHIITLVDQYGESISRQFEIIEKDHQH